MIPCLQKRANKQVDIQLLIQMLLYTNKNLGLAPNSSPPPIVATAPPAEEYAVAFQSPILPFKTKMLLTVSQIHA